MSLEIVYENENYKQLDWDSMSNDELEEIDLMRCCNKHPYIIGYDKKFDKLIEEDILNIKENSRLNNKDIICIYKVKKTDSISISAITIKK